MLKSKTSQISLLAIASFMLLPMANAENYGKSKEACEARKAAYLERIAPYDSNGDGELSDEEKISLKKERFETADLDKNGGLTFEEMLQFHEQKKAEREAMMVEKHFSKMDEDGDGVASFEEFSEGSKMASQHKKKRLKKSRSFKKQMHKHVLEQFDADGDGELSDDEKLALKRSKFETADINSDGNLTQEEIAAFKENEHAQIHQMMQTKRFEKIDTDADGIVSFDEFSKAKLEKNKDKHFKKCS